MSAHILSQYKTAKSGSTLVCVVLITGCLITAIISCWHVGVLRQNLIYDRIRYEQRFRLAQGALHYGITYASTCFNDLYKAHEASIDLNEYAQLLDARYRARIVFFVQKQSVCVKAYVSCDQEHVFCIRCIVTQEGDKYRVSGWKIER